MVEHFGRRITGELADKVGVADDAEAIAPAGEGRESKSERAPRR
jgi:hypothetical protein